MCDGLAESGGFFWESGAAPVGQVRSRSRLQQDFRPEDALRGWPGLAPSGTARVGRSAGRAAGAALVRGGCGAGVG